MKNNRFRNVGFGPTYNCFCCGRRTRYTGGEGGNCLECYEIAGLDNSVNDNGYKPGTTDYAGARKEADRLLAVVAKRGGNAERVKKLNGFIWGRT